MAARSASAVVFRNFPRFSQLITVRTNHLNRESNLLPFHFIAMFKCETVNRFTLGNFQLPLMLSPGMNTLDLVCTLVKSFCDAFCRNWCNMRAARAAPTSSRIPILIHPIVRIPNVFVLNEICLCSYSAACLGSLATGLGISLSILGQSLWRDAALWIFWYSVLGFRVVL